jgi:hypothetical protein
MNVHYKTLTIYLIITTIKWCQSSQTEGYHFKFLFLRKPFMLGKNGIRVFGHIFPDKLTLKFLGDHSLTPCILKWMPFQGHGDGRYYR